MTPRDIFRQVRMAAEVNDNAEVKYSDYQLISALNSVLSMVYNALSGMNSEVLVKRETVELEDGEGDLPEDFLSMVAAFANGAFLLPQGKSREVTGGTYKIRGGKIYSDNSEIALEYKPYFEPVEYDTMEDDLDLPAYFGELLKKYCVVSLIGGINQSDSSVLDRITQDVQALTAGRSYSRIADASEWGAEAATWAGAI